MAMTPEEIAYAAKCFCFPNADPVLLYLLDQIRINGGGSVMTPAQIAEAAKCYCVPEMEKAILFELDQIRENGGGGGGGGDGVVRGSGSPVGVVTPTQVGELYSRTDAPELWQATGLTNADWIQMV